MIRNPSFDPTIELPVMSLWQLWASAVVLTDKDTGTAYKQNETRSWETTYRGPVVIHAAKKWDREVQDMCDNAHFKKMLRDYFGRPYVDPDIVPFGKLIGIVDIVNCVSTNHPYFHKADFRQTREFALGNYDENRFAIRLKNPREFANPIPWKGVQGWFNVPLSELPPDMVATTRLTLAAESVR